ncbi:MAG TPA: hypothetical protein VN240_00750 [Propylenella sp.]|nr:hypothetical protein [Propylenella sp.]
MYLRTLMAVAIAASVGPFATPGYAAKGGQSVDHKSSRGGKSAEHRRDGDNKWGGAKGFYKPRPNNTDATE